MWNGIYGKVRPELMSAGNLIHVSLKEKRKPN